MTTLHNLVGYGKNMGRKAITANVGIVVLLMSSLALAKLPHDATGTWKLFVKLENGSEGRPTFVLKQEGEKITGTYSGPLGTHPVSGSARGSSIEFKFAYEADTDHVEIVYSGEFQDEKHMAGKVTVVDGKERRNGKWTGERQ